jgi:hypothetical protein
VANADELIREAQYAFRNISHGSTDERKYTARAKKYAKRVIRKYPASIEASQARSILRQLGISVDLLPPPVAPSKTDEAVDFEMSHARGSGHSGNVSRKPVAHSTHFERAVPNEDWRNLLRRFTELPGGKKNFLGALFVIAIFFPGGILAVSGLVIFYAMKPALLKKHLDQLLIKLGS